MISLAEIDRSTDTGRALTRGSALESARRTYTMLVCRALEIQDIDRSYVLALAHEWDRRLVELVIGFRADVALSDHVQLSFETLDSAVRKVGDDDDDAIVRLVDAYPDAIANLFPPSAATFWVVPAQRATTVEPNREVKVA